MRQREVIVSDEALLQMMSMSSDTDYSRVKKTLKLLETIPCAWPVYDPAYEAARLPVECRVAYAGHYGIYYDGADDADSPVRVIAIEDQRRDPMGKSGSRRGATE